MLHTQNKAQKKEPGFKYKEDKEGEVIDDQEGKRREPEDTVLCRAVLDCF